MARKDGAGISRVQVSILVLIGDVASVLGADALFQRCDTALLFAISVAGLALLTLAFVLETLYAPLRWPTTGEPAGVLYVGLAASVGVHLLSAGLRLSAQMRPGSPCIFRPSSVRCWRWSFSAKRSTHSTPLELR